MLLKKHLVSGWWEYQANWSLVDFAGQYCFQGQYYYHPLIWRILESFLVSPVWILLHAFYLCWVDYPCLCVVPPQSWGDRSDTKHSKCLLLGGRRLNQLTLITKPKGSGGARAATAQVGPANKRNDTKRCLPIEASLRPGEAVPWKTTECPAVPNTSVQSCCQTSSAPR